MTPYGALRDVGPVAAGEFACACRVCGGSATQLPHGSDLFEHNLWTIAATMGEINKQLDAGTLDRYLEHVLEVHRAWFPRSALASSWHDVQG